MLYFSSSVCRMRRIVAVTLCLLVVSVTVLVALEGSFVWLRHSEMSLLSAPVVDPSLSEAVMRNFTALRFDEPAAVESFESFTSSGRYSLSQRSGFSVTIPWTGYEKQYIEDIIQLAVQRVQIVYGVTVDQSQMLAAHWRHLHGRGEHYWLSFSHGSPASVYTVDIVRQLQSPSVVTTHTPSSDTHTVHIIVPLAGRADKLHSFINRLTALFDNDSRLQLLLVCFGAQSQLGARRRLATWRHVARAHVVARHEPFSRGTALLAGAEAAAKMALASSAAIADPLLFFCDVDVAFDAVAVHRCRANSAPGRSVYYPVVFSEYSPRLVADLGETSVPPAHYPDPADPDPDPAVIDSAHGHWRHYGFGMSCQFLSDFARAAAGGGHLSQSRGWGGEDVQLYTRYLAVVHVVRVLEPHMRHVYHSKQCPTQQLSSAQMRSCVFSQIENEGSKQQLGLLALHWAGRLGPEAHAIFRRPWHKIPVNWLAITLALALAISLAINVKFVVFKYRWRSVRL